MKVKRTTFAFILLAVLTVTAYTPKAYAQQYDSESDFEVKSEGKGITITGYLGSKKEVRIPPSIQELPVTGIGERAFMNQTGITRITIPDGVTSVGVGAFYQCLRLNRLNVASGNKAYIAESSVLYNIDKTFLHTYTAGKTNENFTIPGSVKRIGPLAFEDCTRLKTVTFEGAIPSGDIYYNSFRDLGNLREKFYAEDKDKGTPGTYTRAANGNTWEKQ